MVFAYLDLKNDISAQWAAMKIIPQYLHALDRVAAKLVSDLASRCRAERPGRRRQEGSSLRR